MHKINLKLEWKQNKQNFYKINKTSNKIQK